MPTFDFCFPCSPSSINKDFAEGLSPKEAKDITIVTPIDVQEYAGQAAREFLRVLDLVAQAVPIPALGVAIRVAANVIKACDDSQATLDRAEDLKIRIKTLVAIFVNELKGKKKEEIHARLIEDIDTLNRVLEYIQKTLDRIMSQHCLHFFLFRSLNESKINKCVTMVNNCLESFNLARTIDHTKMLTQLEQQIRTFYTGKQESLETLQVTMNDVKAILNERLPGEMLTTSRASIPANSVIFCGRDFLVEEFVSVLVGASRQHICLLGPGGIGKTSTSLAIMSHPKVKACFADHLRVWVPCIKATSVSLFLDTLHTSLAIRKAGNIRSDILAELKASPHIVVLLDNFETPWNIPGAQSEVEQILRDIHQIPHVTLFVTIRSSSPPCGDIPWHHAYLRAVSCSASHEIYSSWHSEGGEDPDLPQLLDLIGHMPLAVTLMAKVAKVTHLPAAELVEEYNRLGTPMLEQGSDAESSMDICIGLSVNSSRMKDHPEAFDLLCTLSLLSTGTTYRMLSKWWAGNVSNLAAALNVLLSTSLVEKSSGTYSVLPVIQRYILNPSRFNPTVRMSMIESACAFLKLHNSKIGDPLYKSHTIALSLEEGNLEAVLLQVTTQDSSHVVQDGLLLLARYQQYNRPRVDVVEHALKLVQGLNDNILHGDILYCYGDILYKLHQFKRSLQHFDKALDLFLTVPDRRKAATCRLAINNVLGFRHTQAENFNYRERIIIEAQEDFGLVNDKGGVGYCLLSLGVLHQQFQMDSPAVILLKQAEEILAQVEDQHRHAECTRRLAWAYYQSGQYDMAYSWAALSLEESKSIGDLIECQYVAESLGFIISAHGDYPGSLEHFFQCLKIRQEMGLSVRGQVLEGMGLSWAKLGKTTDAWQAFNKSLQQYSSEESTRSSQKGISRTKFFLKQLENPELSPSTEEISAMYGWYPGDYITRILISV